MKQTLVNPTSALVHTLRRLDPNCALPDAFVVHTDGQHIYTRDAGYRERQFNVAFSADSQDTMRIGVGFPMQDHSSRAVLEYAIFRAAVTARPSQFDAIYSDVFGGYGEFDNAPAHHGANLAARIVQDQHGGEWRFFGMLLNRQHIRDAAILSSLDSLAHLVVVVNDQIRNAGF